MIEIHFLVIYGGFMIKEIITDQAKLKASLLFHGFNMNERAIDAFGSPYLSKRRVYGNTDDDNYNMIEVPQEIILKNSNIIVAAILKDNSIWELDFRKGEFFLTSNDFQDVEVSFTKTPPFYDMKTSEGIEVKSIMSMIFGDTLGIFANTTCYFATFERQCQYCSIRSNVARPNDIIGNQTIVQTIEALKMAISNDENMIDHIFLSGGNIHGINDNFIFYVSLAKRVKKIIDESERDIKVMLNVFTPNDLSLINNLKDSGISVLVSTEVFDATLFAEYCPGKNEVITKEHLKKGLRKYLDVLGDGNVYSIVMQGLEPISSLKEGILEYAEMGVCPIVNILHVDPGTVIYERQMAPPQPNEMIEIASFVQEVYAANGFDTTRVYGGRSAFDRESSKMMLIQEGIKYG